MRIIAGMYSSRRLETLPGNKTRPTLDKVKEAVFSSLGSLFDGGNVLDLYAGSGAIGLEAISRGFDHAVLVDNNHQACGVIKKNIDTLQCRDCCSVLCMKDTQALSLLIEKKERFDLIYLDPPYAKQHNFEILDIIDKNNLLNPDGKVVIESLKEETYKSEYTHLQYKKEVVYGIMKITYYTYKQDV